MTEKTTVPPIAQILAKADIAKQEVADAKKATSALIQVSLKKDWAGVPEETRVRFVSRLCEALNINPVLNPFRFIDMKGVTVLYADKRAASLIANANRISTEITKEVFDKEKQILKIYVRATDPHGVYTDEFAAIHLGANAGDVRANLEMKCLSKAKRRAILALKDLSVPDEEELQFIRETQSLVMNDREFKEHYASTPVQLNPIGPEPTEKDEVAEAQEEVMDVLTGGDPKKVAFMNKYIANALPGKKLSELTYDECQQVLQAFDDDKADKVPPGVNPFLDDETPPPEENK